MRDDACSVPMAGKERVASINAVPHSNTSNEAKLPYLPSNHSYAKVTQAVQYYIYWQMNGLRMWQVRFWWRRFGGLEALLSCIMPLIVCAAAQRPQINNNPCFPHKQEAILWRAATEVFKAASRAGITLTPSQTNPRFFCALAQRAKPGEPLEVGKDYCNVRCFALEGVELSA
jgi:hypothetical protein